MRTNHVKEKLGRGEAVFGAWLGIPSPLVARLMARIPFDWLMVDMEHGPVEFTTMVGMVGAIADAGGPAPMVRIPSNSVENIKRALDSGAWGILVPMVNSASEAEAVVAASKYPPEGNRSIGGMFAPLGFSTERPEYAAQANREIIIGVQIESREGLANVEEILSVPGIDLAFIGPNDLHAALGLPPSNEGAEPEFVAAEERIKAVADRHNIPVGMYSSNGKMAAKRAQEGYRFISICTDFAALLGGLSQNLQDARES